MERACINNGLKHSRSLATFGLVFVLCGMALLLLGFQSSTPVLLVLGVSFGLMGASYVGGVVYLRRKYGSGISS